MTVENEKDKSADAPQCGGEEYSGAPPEADFISTLQRAFARPSARGGAVLDHWETYCFSLVKSTMDAAHFLRRSGLPPWSRFAESGAESGGEALVLAAEQLAGRGREGRAWHSAPFAGLYATFSLFPHTSAAAINGLPLAAAIAVCRTAERFGAVPRVKWPNDVLLHIDGRWMKLAGILVESSVASSSLESVRLGVGLNLNQEHFPAEVPGVSLYQATGRRIDYFAAAAALAEEMRLIVDEFYAGGFPALRSAWLALSAFTGCMVEVKDARSGRRLAGRMRGINEEGALLLETDCATGSAQSAAGPVDLERAVTEVIWSGDLLCYEQQQAGNSCI